MKHEGSCRGDVFSHKSMVLICKGNSAPTWRPGVTLHVEALDMALEEVQWYRQLHAQKLTRHLRTI